jgi:hypothetical protein
MVNNGQAVPLAVTLHGGPAAVSRDSPTLTLAITNLKVSESGQSISHPLAFSYLKVCEKGQFNPHAGHHQSKGQWVGTVPP